MIGGHEITSNKNDSSIPEEFLCAINGHVMKDPVRSTRSGLVFEKATIQIWLQTRGQVCPITHQVFSYLSIHPSIYLSIIYLLIYYLNFFVLLYFKFSRFLLMN